MHDDREMNPLSKLLICAVTITSPALADLVTDSAAAAPPTTATPQFPEGETRLRRGIVLQGSLCQQMAGVNDYNSAEAAVPHIMRIYEELQQWTQAFSNLPPLSELEAQVYEERYLPTIRKINQMLAAQADRLAAAEYYGSKNLPAALVRVAQVGHK